MTGYYGVKSFAYRGFLRSSSGAIATFQVPGSGTKNYLGTFPYSINQSGAITGC